MVSMKVKPGRPDRLRRARALALALVLAGVAADQAVAGPPYLNDDPEPTDLGHWEIYNFVNGAKDHGAVTGEGGIDLNYGAFKDVQLTAVFPAGYTSDGGYRLKHLAGYSGVVELAAKYKLVHQDEHSLVPDVAVFPRVFIPTNSHFGPRRTNLLLPVWAQKDWGDWSVFGGGDTVFNAYH